jgi:RNA polymerase sigma-70 factor (ECF subfamily)
LRGAGRKGAAPPALSGTGWKDWIFMWFSGTLEKNPSMLRAQRSSEVRLVRYSWRSGVQRQDLPASGSLHGRREIVARRQEECIAMSLPSSFSASGSAIGPRPVPSFENQLMTCMPALRRYALALTRSPEDSQDLVHDLVALAIQKQHLWRPGSNLRAWLFTLQHNIFINQRRRSAGRTSTPIEEETLTFSVEADQEEKVSLMQTEAALQAIPAPQRIVVILVFVRGFSYAEAAQILNIPLGTVRSRLARAREHLRHMLQ